MKINWDSLTTRLIIVVIVSWVILAIIFGFTDLYISIAIVDKESLWGNFGADFGETPGWALIFIAIAILIGSLMKDIKKQKIGGFIAIILGAIYLVYYIIEGSQKRAIDGAGIIISVLIFLILTFNKDWRNYRTIAMVIFLLAIMNPLLFVQITKASCGRVRFRDLAIDYSNYTPWFLPPGPTGNQSFPSGHASMGFMLLPLLILVKRRNWNEPVKIIFYVIILGWGVFVAASRVVVGAHYASDVLFSSEMAALITILLYKHFFLKKELDKRNEGIAIK